jgi:hypothetical protein
MVQKKRRQVTFVPHLPFATNFPVPPNAERMVAHGPANAKFQGSDRLSKTAVLHSMQNRSPWKAEKIDTNTTPRKT